jgi:hypothetical protein
MAEREGFEPSVELSPHTHLAGERLQPTRPSLRNPAEAGLLFPFMFLQAVVENLFAKSSLLPATGEI